MNIIHKDCDVSLAKDKSLPTNSYIIKYLNKGKETFDIVQAGSFVEVFDAYYDEYGKETIKSIKWTNGNVNPRIWGYKPPEKKKRR